MVELYDDINEDHEQDKDELVSFEKASKRVSYVFLFVYALYEHHLLECTKALSVNANQKTIWTGNNNMMLNYLVISQIFQLSILCVIYRLTTNY